MIARTRGRGIVVTAASVAAIAIAAWPVQSLRPGFEHDWDWVAGLAYVAEHGMRFGDQIAWSYGPLGFLNTWYGPVVHYGDLLLLSWLYVALLQVLLAIALTTALRRSLRLPLAALTAAVVLALTRDVVPALGLAWCVHALARPDDAPRGHAAAAFPLALGVLTGIALLGKLNLGVELLALAVVALVSSPRRRDAVAFAAALLASATAAWLATGQTLADVWPYLRNGVETVSGYAAAMGADQPAYRWTYAVALGLVALALALTWTSTRGLPRRRRSGMLALSVVYVGLSFKEGFVRQDAGHLEIFFGNMAALFAVLPLHAPGALLAPALTGILVVVGAIGGVQGADHVARKLNPYANAAAAADQVRTLASPARRDATSAAARAHVLRLYDVPPEVRAAVGRRTVMPWPYLLGDVAFAYGFELRPFPSFEPYAAYTPALDRLGARMLVSERAPSRILRATAVVIDGRHATFEAPLATREIFCRYRQSLGRDPWQVLVRAPNRCGVPRPLASRRAPWGVAVPVPRPRDPQAAVLVHVEGAGTQGLEHLLALALRPRPRWIALDGQRFRLVAATAPDGLLLSAPPRLDYPAPFAMAPRPRAIAVGRDGGQPGGTLTYRFVELPLRPVAAVARAP